MFSVYTISSALSRGAEHIFARRPGFDIFVQCGMIKDKGSECHAKYAAAPRPRPAL